jgi:hypothetical protein
MSRQNRPDQALSRRLPTVKSLYFRHAVARPMNVRTVCGDKGWFRNVRCAALVGFGTSMIPKSGHRFSDKIMLNQKVRACFTLLKGIPE